MYLPKEFKSFVLKVDSTLLLNIGKDNCDYSMIDYFEVSSQIQRGLKQKRRPEPLTYIFSDLRDIPDKILQLVDVRKDLLGKVDKLSRCFRQFRQQKNVIKNIKYKTEIIKANKQEWKVIDKVCRVLVLGQRDGSQRCILKYNKSKGFNLSNLRQITAKGIGLRQIPKWLMKCTNLKILQLEFNALSQIKQEQLPYSLMEISLHSNNIHSINISNSSFNSLTKLNLFNNNLQSLTFGFNNTSLRELWIHNNLELRLVKNWPPYLDELRADQYILKNIDFLTMVNLKKVYSYNGQISKRELKNIKDLAQCHNR